MNVLVIGGTGLISSAIVCGLVERGDTVTILNRGLTPGEPFGEVRRIRCDRRAPGALEAAVLDTGEAFDVAIDMTAFEQTDAEALVTALGGRVEQLIFCSTVEVYSKPARRLPVDEGAEREPTFSYGRGKVVCEEVLTAAHEDGRFALTVIRPAYTYGEGKPLIYPLGDDLYLERLINGRPLVLPGDGATWWVACHRDDVAAAFVAATGLRAAFGNAYNVTGEDVMTWPEWHRRAAEALGAPEPVLVPMPPDLLIRAAPAIYAPRDFVFTSHYLFENASARCDLAFVPTVPLEDGVRRVAAWQEAHSPSLSVDAHALHDRLVDAWSHLSASLLGTFDGAGNPA